MRHTRFKENQSYKSSPIYNQKEDRIYNKMYTSDWWWEKQKKLLAGATIIPILLTSDKTVMILSLKDQIFYLVYVTIDNLDVKTHQSQNRPGTLLVGYVPIVHKQAEDSNNKDGDFKIKTYHLTLKTIVECI